MKLGRSCKGDTDFYDLTGMPFNVTQILDSPEVTKQNTDTNITLKIWSQIISLSTSRRKRMS